MDTMSNAKRLTMQGGTTLDGFALLVLFQVCLKVDSHCAHFLRFFSRRRLGTGFHLHK